MLLLHRCVLTAFIKLFTPLIDILPKIPFIIAQPTSINNEHFTRHVN